jgi:UDP-N-acetylmuramoyl-tripeptide--D-alanyl-D-alanine ligase
MMNFLTLLAASAFLYFAQRRLLRYLHIYQQDEYDSARFVTWMARSLAIDRKLTAVLLLIFAASLPLAPELKWLPLVTISGAFALFGYLEPNPRAKGKKPLVLTKRATSIMWGSLGVLVLLAGCAALWGSLWSWPIIVHAIPFSLVLANFVLKPIEGRNQRRLLDEAASRLAEINPTVIGITGSFGKTSTKHILGHILSLNSRCYITPGSVNTPMGITRVIRESLPQDSRFFAVEMGAYGPGSIARLCELTPPSFGVITSIGEAHFERFRNLETVARTKFELAESVLSHPQGRMIIHSSVCRQEYARALVNEHRDRFVICGDDPDVDVRIVRAEHAPDGLRIHLESGGEEHHIQTPLFGMQQVGNVALAFAAAVEAGISPQKVVMALRTTPQIAHRLEVKRQRDGSILIDDAYNSNPIGFAAGLELMDWITQSGGRRILVTPGLVELGTKHDEVHRELGMLAGKRADIVVTILPARIYAFTQGFLLHADPDRLVTVATFDEASAWMQSNVKSQDVVLIENDLPDLYERHLSL